MTATEHFDVVIIGTGSGNSLLDERFADKKVAICEEGVFGGTCLNVGCIPTKMFVFAADVANVVQRGSRVDVDAKVEQVRWRDIVSRVFDEKIDLIAAGGEDYRRNHPDNDNVTVFDGHARFVDEKTIDTGTGATITGDQILIAAGARPTIPGFVTESGVPFHTNDDIMRIPELPKRLVILGSGFIACEFAHVFSAFGVEVTVIGRSDVLLKHSDRTIAERFTEHARESWDVRLGQSVESISGGPGDIHVHFPDGSEVVGDALLVATGRVSNGDLLDPGAGGVEMDDGRIRVDEYGRTTAQDVWAIGDVSSPFQLKHVANHEVRVVQHNMTTSGELQPFQHRVVPYAVFSDPQLASVGLTEAEAEASGRRIAVKVQEYGDVAYGWAMNDRVGCCKVIADADTQEILGAHVMGLDAATVIQPLTQAMTFGLPAMEMARGQYWIHPALAEVVENALLGLGFDDPGF